LDFGSDLNLDGDLGIYKRKTAGTSLLNQGAFAFLAGSFP